MGLFDFPSNNNSKKSKKTKTCGEHYSSVFVKSKYKSSKEKGYQAINYDKPYCTKSEARAAARREINEMKKTNPYSKHLKFSAHVASRK